MDIWTILTIVSIPPTVVYYAAKWHRARLAKRDAIWQRAVYRMRERGPIPVYRPVTPARIATLRASPGGVVVNSFTPVSEETLMQQAPVTLGMDADVQMMPVPDLAPIADTITEMQQEISSSTGVSDTFSSGGDFGGGSASGSWDSGSSSSDSSSSYDSGSGSSY